MNQQTKPKAVTARTMFSRETTVGVEIEAEASIVWALLTRAADYPRWNSTVISIKGDIREGETIELKSTLDEKRTFKLKVKEFSPEKRLVWGDAMGNRVYALEKAGSKVRFTMTEKIGGPLFPLFAGMIPSFDESFEKFAADLKKEAETIQRSKN
ncbi:MAG TPA: SRPBCC domain-containing protein [Anaerolineales bacterium]|nr:SRPBCC domain-containing protein [Anaerolineales bacterium]HNC09661.1 SRPBCC domain-containing protein [Anaerolineales bacterium]